jgi:GH25 family lysozyme M1 (1,4-beta-N-acetylmuramidase)
MRLGPIVASGMLFRGGVPVASAATTASCEGAADHYAGSQIVVADGARGSPDQSARYSVADQVLGHDVCGHQGSVDWPGAVANGAKFVYIKATEGTCFVNPQFAQQSDCSYGVGMTRGSYHFARPDVSSGATEQANRFLNHDGGWSNDGQTLPGALDAECNPYSGKYGLDAPTMTSWIKEFSDAYIRRTSRPPTIYTSTSWWNRCTGNHTDFGSNPLWRARYSTQMGELPAGWHTRPSGNSPKWAVCPATRIIWTAQPNSWLASLGGDIPNGY